jgi:Plasmid replication region DNA-binding N-term
MIIIMKAQNNPPKIGTGGRGFEARAVALRIRVAQAAQALRAQGLRPTVARVRQALGGGSPNDLAPALKSWRDSVRAGPDDATPFQQGGLKAGAALPPLVVDLVRELWHSARAAAALELKHGPGARELTSRTAETQALREQLQGLRQQLERESLAYGELRTRAARHETLAKEALAQLHQAQARERTLLRQLGAARQREAQWAAQLDQRTGAAHRGSPSPARRGKPHRRKRPTRVFGKSKTSKVSARRPPESTAPRTPAPTKPTPAKRPHR